MHGFDVNSFFAKTFCEFPSQVEQDVLIAEIVYIQLQSSVGEYHMIDIGLVQLMANVSKFRTLAAAAMATEEVVAAFGCLSQPTGGSVDTEHLGQSFEAGISPGGVRIHPALILVAIQWLVES